MYKILTILLIFHCHKYVIANTYEISTPSGFSIYKPELKNYPDDETSHENNDKPTETADDKEEEVANSEKVIHKRKVLSQPISFSYNKDHEDSKAKPKKEAHKSGGGKTNFSEHKSSGGEKGEKGHKGYHGDEYSKKGHHDKEGHKGSYNDEGGKKKKHFDEHGFEGEHHKIEKGEKKSKYEEEGDHKKGHNTKGEHNIKKQNHYEKKHEFFDEYYEDGHNEKHGGHHSEKDFHKGGSKKGSHGGSGHHEDHYGKKGHNEKGKHYSEEHSHKKAAGHDDHHKHDEKYGKKSSKENAKKWGFKKGDGGGGKGKKKGKLDAHESGTEEKLYKIQNTPQNPNLFFVNDGEINTNRRNDLHVNSEDQRHDKVDFTSHDPLILKNNFLTDKEVLEINEEQVLAKNNNFNDQETKTTTNTKIVKNPILSYSQDVRKTDLHLNSDDRRPEKIELDNDGDKINFVTDIKLLQNPQNQGQPKNNNLRDAEATNLAMIVKSPIPNYSQVRNVRRADKKNKLRAHLPEEILYINKMLMDKISNKHKDWNVLSENQDSIFAEGKNDYYKCSLY